MTNKLLIDGVEYDRDTFSESAKALDDRISRINFQIEEKKKDIEDLNILNDVLVRELVTLLEKEVNSEGYSTSYLSRAE